MKDNKTSVNLTFPIPTILTIVFVILKLCGVITWSWVWVLSPLWIGFALGVVIIFLFIVIPALSRAIIKKRKKRE